MLEINSEPCPVRDALQGGSLAEAGLVAGISDRAAGAKDVLGDVSFIEVIEAGQGGTARAFVGKRVLGSNQLRDQRAGLESHLHHPPTGRPWANRVT